MRTKHLAAIAAAAAAFCAPLHAQWVTLTDSGSPILATINPKTTVTPTPSLCTNTGAAPSGGQLPVNTQSSSLSTGKFGGLPGSAAMTGYILYRTNTTGTALQTGSPAVTVGTLYDRVYCTSSNGTSCDGTNTYVFATRAILNTNAWDPSGGAFEINDFFRAVPTAATGVQVGYYMGTSGGSVPDDSQAFKYLEYAGRTNTGLGQTITRSQGFVAFRADTNASDPDRCEPYSFNSSNSPWMYAKLTCSSGVTTSQAAFKIRVRQGGEEGQPIVSISTSGFACN
jgi:hypothetical protein